ncbi:MAG: DNA photolyase family protein, partial [Arenicella sp.]|nr:DNA photolyase family protein [Arenicella sp.]
PELQTARHHLTSEALESWKLLPTHPDWSTGLAERWRPGEAGAAERWRTFLEGTVNDYKGGRDFPALEQTSMLSPHLTAGEISARQLWFDTQQAMAAGEIDMTNGQKFLAEIGWREFSRYLLVHFPHMTEQPFNTKFLDFPWQNNDKLLKSWRKGETGYPIVDAGMRELWHTGYMHNRVRMIVASFLTKHCLIHWQQGMDWFWDTLVDADVANNTASWQWVAGCGADASPYFRIFNPTLQSAKFDGQGVYIKRWVPELTGLPAKQLHEPWLADKPTLQQAGVVLGENYPLPIVDHKQAREQALLAYQAIKNQ